MSPVWFTTCRVRVVVSLHRTKSSPLPQRIDPTLQSMMSKVCISLTFQLLKSLISNNRSPINAWQKRVHISRFPTKNYFSVKMLQRALQQVLSPALNPGFPQRRVEGGIHGCKFFTFISESLTMGIQIAGSFYNW